MDNRASEASFNRVDWLLTQTDISCYSYIMKSPPNCIPNDIYKPDDEDLSFSWIKSKLPCPKCSSKDTWEFKDRYECNDCDYKVKGE